MVRRNFDANCPAAEQLSDYDVLITTDTLAEGVTATPSYDCGNVNLADITTADDGKSCNVKILVQYTFGADNTHSGIIENNGDGTHEGTGWQKAPEGQGKALDVPSFKVVLEQKMRPSL